MANFIFLILHFIALAFGGLLLLITIPLHMIYSSVSKSTKVLLDKEKDLARSKELDIPIEEITKGRKSAEKLAKIFYISVLLFFAIIIYWLS